MGLPGPADYEGGQPVSIVVAEADGGEDKYGLRGIHKMLTGIA